MTAAGTRKTHEEPSAARRPFGSRTVAFATGAARARDLPRPRQPEIALAGRSNVGKSSLLNRLTHRSGMARVSKTPGRTQQINFFLVDGEWFLVDLPGYGFARVPLSVRGGWQALVEAYLQRGSVRGVVLIVDLRRGLQADDEELLRFLDGRGLPVCVAATKADKVARGQRRRHVDALGLRGEREVVVCSAASGEGIAELGAIMRSWLEAT